MLTRRVIVDAVLVEKNIIGARYKLGILYPENIMQQDGMRKTQMLNALNAMFSNKVQNISIVYILGRTYRVSCI